MPSEEKKYLLSKKESYEERIKKQNTAEIIDAVCLGIVTGATVNLGASVGFANEWQVNAFVYFALISGSIVDSIYLKKLLDDAGEKAYLKSKLEDIRNELEKSEGYTRKLNK